MTREFIRIFEFEKQCENIGLNEDDILSVEIRILIDPACGDMIQGTGGIRKLRVALGSKGKTAVQELLMSILQVMVRLIF